MKENQQNEKPNVVEGLHEGPEKEELQGKMNVVSNKPCTFKICGDNIDKSVKLRYMCVKEIFLCIIFILKLSWIALT